MFLAFHHFSPELAVSVLADAVAKRAPIAIFDGSDHRAAMILGLGAAGPLSWAAAPWITPFRWDRLALSWLIPAIPGLVLFDGAMSALRVYGRDELWELVDRVPDARSFRWRIGEEPIPRSPVGVTYLVGTPV